MGTCREKRDSEKKLDTVFNVVRSLDVKVWSGQKHFIEDIKEDVEVIKRYLDSMVEEYEIECGVKKRKPTVPQPNLSNLLEPTPPINKDWPRDSKAWDIQSPDQT